MRKKIDEVQQRSRETIESLQVKVSVLKTSSIELWVVQCILICYFQARNRELTQEVAKLRKAAKKT